MITMKDIYDLKERLKEDGWVVSNHVSVKGIENNSIDMMATKNGGLGFFNLVNLESHSSTMSVVDQRSDLERAVGQAAGGTTPQGKHMKKGVNAYFAIWKKGHKKWFASHYNVVRLRYKDKHTPLSQVLNIV